MRGRFQAFVVIAAMTGATLVACAGSRPARSQAPPPTPVVAQAAPDAAAGALPVVEEVPSVEALASRGSSEMPLMREVARVEDATKPSVLEVRSADACFRAVVAASVPVRVWFEDERRAPRGAELSATSGLVPPRGPACARKGETLRLVVDAQGAAATARAVVWQAP